MARPSKYEVQADVSGKPQIDGIFNEEKDALARAEYLLRQAKYTAVRVLVTDSRDAQKVVFEKAYTGGGKVTNISHIDESNVCKTASDIFTYPSRRTLVRLTRNYCDEQGMIPSEVLHRPLMLRQLEREASMFNQIIHRLGAIQGQQLRMKPERRSDELTRFYRELLEWAKSAESLQPLVRKLAEDGLDALIAHVRSTLPETEHPRAINYAFAMFLEQARDWGDKVRELCYLCVDGQSPEASAYLDEMIAEAIDGNAPIRSLLGYAPDLGAALSSLALTSKGLLDDRYPHTEALLLLSRTIDYHPLPITKEILVERVARAISGTAKLTRLDKSAEAEAFRRLVPLVQEYGGFIGGREMAEGITRRTKTALALGDEDLSFEESVAKVITFLPNKAGVVGYLLDLLATDFGRKKATFLMQKLGEVFATVGNIVELMPEDVTSDTMDAVIEGFRKRFYSGGIPSKLADMFMARLKQMAQSPASARPSVAPAAPAAARPPAAPPKPAARAMDDETISISSVTAIRTPARTRPHVVLRYRGAEFVCDGQKVPYIIGRSTDCDLTVTIPSASRQHAHIRPHGDNFLLIDQSKNGTFVRVGEYSPIVLNNNGSVILSSSGEIYLGSDPSQDQNPENSLIRFTFVVPGA
ncbi:putative FHA domain-containing protein [Azospirillaceae bacterium]